MLTVCRDVQSIGDDPKMAAKRQKASNEDKDAKLTYRARNRKGQASWRMETLPPSSWSLGVRRPRANLGQTTTLGGSEREGRIGFDCLSVNPKRARMGSLLVLDCTLYILEYMQAAQGYP